MASRKKITKKSTKRKSTAKSTRKKAKAVKVAPPQDMPAEAFEIHAKSEDLVGGYSNVAVIKHGKREFILDFLFRVDNMNSLVSRIVTNPHHAKAIHRVLGKNIEKYEELHGKIEEE